MLLLEGVKLMLVGMAVVFSFLALLVAAMRGSAAFCLQFAHLFPEPEPAVDRSAGQRDDLAEVALAIAAVKTRSNG